MTHFAPLPAIARERYTARQWLDCAVQGLQPERAVLVHAPSAAFQAPGGGEVQLVETSRALAAHGCRVRPFVPWVDQLAGARLLHIFGMSREGLALGVAARAAGLVVVLSPICWYEHRLLSGGAALRMRTFLAQRAFFPKWPHWRRELLRLARVVLPNSQAEANQLARLFAVDPAVFRVIPNGVSPDFSAPDPSAFRAVVGEEDFVLYAGRIEPRKNVRGLIDALARGGPRLVVLGDPVPGHERYATDCRRAGGSRVTWLARLQHDDPLLASAYAAARVVALVSWFETPGLTALEAALAGSAVAITPLGCTREYFGDLVEYAHPSSPRQIREAVERAWHAPKQPALAMHVESRYLWSHVARQTAEVYDDLASP